MTLYVKNGGSWVEPADTFVKYGGSWHPCNQIWVKNAGVWSPVLTTYGSISFTSNGSFVVPNGVRKIWIWAIGGGGSAGNVVDGGRNDDYGGSGGGASGQYVSGYMVNVVPGETISVIIGAAGSRAGGGRDSPNQGGTGGTTYITASTSGAWYLLGGDGGYGGVGAEGQTFPGGTTSTTNTSFPAGVLVSNGGAAVTGVGGVGGAGMNSSGAMGGTTAGGSYGGGNQFHPELDATNYGGGGAGAWSWYVREDNGNAPSWGGLGASGFALFQWGL